MSKGKGSTFYVPGLTKDQVTYCLEMIPQSDWRDGKPCRKYTADDGTVSWRPIGTWDVKDSAAIYMAQRRWADKVFRMAKAPLGWPELPKRTISENADAVELLTASGNTFAAEVARLAKQDGKPYRAFREACEAAGYDMAKVTAGMWAGLPIAKANDPYATCPWMHPDARRKEAKRAALEAKSDQKHVRAERAAELKAARSRRGPTIQAPQRSPARSPRCECGSGYLAHILTSNRGWRCNACYNAPERPRTAQDAPADAPRSVDPTPAPIVAEMAVSGPQDRAGERAPRRCNGIRGVDATGRAVCYAHDTALECERARETLPPMYPMGIPIPECHPAPEPAPVQVQNIPMGREADMAVEHAMVARKASPKDANAYCRWYWANARGENHWRAWPRWQAARLEEVAA